MNKEQIIRLEKKYGQFSSFAMWADPDRGEKSNTSNLSIFENDWYLDAHTNYCFIDLTGSTRYNQRRDGKKQAWMNFHSDAPRQNEYKLRYALKNTPLWASYMTCIIKTDPTITNLNFQKRINENPYLLKQSILSLKEELMHLPTKPILIALGGVVYRILRQHFDSDYTVLVIKHPSFDINLEEYKQEIIEKASLNID